MSVKVILEDGSQEKYHKAYIIESLESVGLDHRTAKDIANEVKKHKGITEQEIKEQIFQILVKIDIGKANMFMKTKKVLVKKESMQVIGNVLLPEFLMKNQELRNGDRINIFHGENSTVLRAYGMTDQDNHQDHNTIFMSEKDMKGIDVQEKHQVAIRKYHSN